MVPTSMTTSHSHLWPGVPLALASAALFGASTPFAKLLLGSVDPWLLAGLLYLGAGLGLALVQLARSALRLPAAEAPLRRADLPWLAAVVAAGGVVGPLLLMLGLARTDAASGALLLNLEGLATMALAWLVFRENVDRRLLAGALAILAGAVLLSWQGRGAGLDLGALLIAGACLAWGIDNNLTRKLSSADPVQIALAKGLIAGTVNLTLALVQRRRPARRRHRRWRPAWSVFSATASASSCSCWPCAISAPRAPAPISRWRRSSARCWRSCCSASRSTLRLLLAPAA